MGDIRRRTVILLVCGYGFFRASSSLGYLNAMGTVSVNVGFISQMPFMLSACVFGGLVAAVIMVLARCGRLRPFRLAFVPAYLIFAIALVAGNTMSSLGIAGLPLSLSMGLFYGVGHVVIGIAWLEVFVSFRQKWVPMLIVIGYLVGVGFLLCFELMGASPAVLVVALAALGFSAFCLHEVRKANPAPVGEELMHPQSNAGHAFIAALLCLLICEFVESMANTAIFGSTFEPLMGNVNMNLCGLISSGLVLIVYFVARRKMDVTLAYRFCMPIMLVVFSLMPFLVDSIGAIAGYAMVICYDFLAVAFSVFLVGLLRDGGFRPYYYLSMNILFAEATLTLGLVTGMALTMLSNDHGVPLLTMLAVIVIYPLGLGLLFIQRRGQSRDVSPVFSEEVIARYLGGRPATVEEGARRDDEVRSGGDGSSSRDGGGRSERANGLLGADAPGEDGGPARTLTEEQVDEFYRSKMASFAKDHGLTTREEEICTYLARGRSVKFITQELFITDNTVWSHIKNIYSKCGVGSKQELMALFERSL